MNEVFDGLTSALGIEYQEDIEKHIQIIEEKKNALIEKKNNNLIFDDQNFLKEELKTLILSARTVMVKLEKDLKVGTTPRAFEVYARLLTSVGEQYRVLLDLNKAIFDAKVETNQIDINNVGNKKLSLTSDQLIDLMKTAQDKSELNQIDATFEIQDVENEDKRKSK